MSRIHFLSAFFILTFSAPSFASCELEQEERASFRKNFESATQVAGTICRASSWWTIFSVVGSLASCTAAKKIAENQQKILEEKETNLKNCEDKILRDQQWIEQQETERKAKINSIQVTYNTKRDQLFRFFEVKALQLILDFETCGLDLSNPALQQDLKEKQDELHAQLRRELEVIELERKEALTR